MFYHPGHYHGLTSPTLTDLLGSHLALAHFAPAICLQAVSCIYSQHFCWKTFFPSAQWQLPCPCHVCAQRSLQVPFSPLPSYFSLWQLCLPDISAHWSLPARREFRGRGLGLCSLWCTWCQRSEWPVGGAHSHVSTEGWSPSRQVWWGVGRRCLSWSGLSWQECVLNQRISPTLAKTNKVQRAFKKYV